MSSKFTLALFLSLYCLPGCRPEKVAKQKNAIKKCNFQDLEKEISIAERVVKCRTSKKGGEVKLHFWLDEKGVPRRVRNTLASTDEWGQRRCAFDSLDGFNSATQKSCEAEIVFSFKSSTSKYASRLSMLRDAFNEKVSVENIKTFRQIFREHGSEMRIGDMDLITLYARAIYALEGLEDHETINPLVLLKKFVKLDQADVNRNVGSLDRPEIYAFFAQLNFEKLIQPSQGFENLEETIQNIKLAKKFLEDHGSHAQKSLVNDYYGEGKLLLIKVAREQGFEWMELSIKELERLEAIEKSILNSLSSSMRIAAKRKHTDRPQTFRSVRRLVKKGLFRKRFLELQKTRHLRKRILEHRLQGCPGKETYRKYRLAVNEFALGKTKSTKKFATLLRRKMTPEFNRLLLASSKDREQVAQELESGIYKEICWLAEWEDDFRAEMEQRRDKLYGFIQSNGPMVCGKKDDEVNVSMIVASHGRISKLKVGNTSSKTVQRCVRKKILSLQIPSSPNGHSVAVDVFIPLN